MENNKNRIVVKVGTSTLTHENGSVDIRTTDRLCRVLSDLKNAGNEIVLVSSGAISVGVSKMRLSERPKEMRMKQAAAAVGQCELMHIYDKLFGEYGNMVGQILLTDEDVEKRVEEMATAQGKPAPDVKKNMQARQLDYIKNEIVIKKFFELLKTSNTIE